MKERVSAAMLRDKKILLVTSNTVDFFFTPGGTVEKDEKKEDALKRELKEELGVEVFSAKLYISYENIWKSKERRVYCYFVEYKGDFILQSEISEIFWYSKDNYLKRKPALAGGIEDNLVPKLIRDDFL